MPPKGAKILCDQGVSYELITALRNSTAFDFSSTAHEGWAEIPDNQLLRMAEQHGFSVLVTTDKNMVYQQNTQKRKIGIVILGSTDTDVVLTYMRQIIVAIQSITRSPKAVPVPMSRPRRTKRSTSVTKDALAFKTKSLIPC